MTTRGLQTLVFSLSLCLQYHDKLEYQHNSFTTRLLLCSIPDSYNYVHKEPNHVRRITHRI